MSRSDLDELMDRARDQRADFRLADSFSSPTKRPRTVPGLDCLLCDGSGVTTSRFLSGIVTCGECRGTGRLTVPQLTEIVEDLEHGEGHSEGAAVLRQVLGRVPA